MAKAKEFPAEMRNYPQEWIVLSIDEPMKLLGHGKTPEAAMASAGVKQEEPLTWSLFYWDGWTGIRI